MMYKQPNLIKVSYPGIFIMDEYSGNILVEIPDLGCFAGGETIEEAFEDARAAIEEYMQHGVLPYASTEAEIEDRVSVGDIVMYIEAIT